MQNTTEKRIEKEFPNQVWTKLLGGAEKGKGGGRRGIVSRAKLWVRRQKELNK